MRKAIMMIMLAGFMTASVIVQGAQKGEDEGRLRNIVQAMQSGWNAGDGKAFAAPFAEDANYVVVNGRHVKGRETIAEGHKGIFSSIYKGSTLAGTIQEIRFFRPDVAYVRVEWHLKFKKGVDWQESEATNTMILTKDDGQWKIVAFQNTPLEKNDNLHR